MEKFKFTKKGRIKVYNMFIYDIDNQCVGWSVASSRYLSTTVSSIMDDGYTVRISYVNYSNQECKVIVMHSK
nr:MAG TPA: hypothetical protein [Microviridae sp.]